MEAIAANHHQRVFLFPVFSIGTATVRFRIEEDYTIPGSNSHKLGRFLMQSGFSALFLQLLQLIVLAHMERASAFNAHFLMPIMG